MIVGCYYVTCSWLGRARPGLQPLSPLSKSNLSCQVIEKGALVNSLLHYPTEMVFFTTPELMEIGGMPFVSPYDKPTRLEALRYYRRVSDAFKLDIVFDEAVVAIARDTSSPTTAGSSSSTRKSARGVRRSVHGRTVVIATGAYDVPNRIGVPGEDLPHVSHYYTQPHPFFRKQRRDRRRQELGRGGRARSLSRRRAASRIVHRGAAMGDSIKYWVKPDIDNRIKEGSIAARFNTRVVEIVRRASSSNENGSVEEIDADAVFLLTGYGSDTTLLRSAGVEIDRRDLRSGVRCRDVRNERAADSIRRRRDGGGAAKREDLHRERPLPRRAGDRGNPRKCDCDWLQNRGPCERAERSGERERRVETVSEWRSPSDSLVLPAPLVLGDDHFHFQQLDERSAAVEQAVALEQRLFLDRLELEVLRERVDQIFVRHRRRDLRLRAASVRLRHEQRLQPAPLPCASRRGRRRCGCFERCCRCARAGSGRLVVLVGNAELLQPCSTMLKRPSEAARRA